MPVWVGKALGPVRGLFFCCCRVAHTHTSIRGGAEHTLHKSTAGCHAEGQPHTPLHFLSIKPHGALEVHHCEEQNRIYREKLKKKNKSKFKLKTRKESTSNYHPLSTVYFFSSQG